MNAMNRRNLLKMAMAATSGSLIRGSMVSGSMTKVPKAAKATSPEDVSLGDRSGDSGKDSATDSWLKRQIGIQLAHEQFTVPQLLELGVAAEQAGFDLLASSDHLQPWQACKQGRSYKARSQQGFPLPAEPQVAHKYCSNSFSRHKRK